MFGHLLMAVRDGLVDEKTIDKAVTRLITTRMKLGLFDNPENVPFNKIGYDKVDNNEHKELNIKASRKSIVLLKNEGNLLPLDKSKLKTVGVIGPNANNRKALVGNYEGTASEYITVLEGIKEYLGEDIRVYYSEGCHLFKKSSQALGMENDRIAEAKTVCEMSDVVIACFGLDPGLEGEEGDQGNEFASGDKNSLNLPGIQEDVLKELYNCGKPVILVLLSGSALSVTWADEHIPAIVQGWYPGAQGGRAIAQVLFGDYSPEGKLPVTFYRTTEELPEFTDYNMANRTYRYMKNEALYPFGYGLSYTDFEISNVAIDSEEVAKGKNVLCTVNIKNTGSMPGAETIQVYVKVKQEGTPNPQLKGLKKVYLNPGELKTISIELQDKAFGLYDNEGRLVLHEGEYEVFIGISQPDERSISLTGKKPYKKIMRSAQTVIL
jgi:beta-glucosidase